MNIFNKVTLQSMKKSRTRTIVTVIGVILSAAMITAVATFIVSLQSYLVNGSIHKNGGWHVEFLDVDPAFVQKRTQDGEVANTAIIENIGYAALDDGINPDKPYLFIAGFNKETFDSLPIHLVSGRLPQNNKEIVVPAHVTANGGVKVGVGDTLSLAVGNRMAAGEKLGQHQPYIGGGDSGSGKEALVPRFQRTYTVVGICERPAYEEYTAPGYTLITTADPANKADSYSVFISLSNPSQVRTYAGDKAGNYSYVLNENVLFFMGLSSNGLFNALLYALGGILIALIMIGSVFLIYNSFAISMNERIQQFGILSSVGATSSQLRNSVLFEGICIGAAGIPVGIILGIGSIWLVISIVGGVFGNLISTAVPLVLVVSAPALIVAAVVSIVTILISAYIPARKAANTPVMESIRQTNEVKIENKDIKTSKLGQRIYGLPGMLARKNFKRNKKRYRSIVLSLTLSVVLFVAASAFTMYLKQAVGQSVIDVDYDLCFSTESMDENEVFRLYDELKTAEGVYKSSYQAILEYSCAVQVEDFSERYREFAGYSSPDGTEQLSLAVQFIEDSEYQRFIAGLGLPLEEYTGENAKMTAVAKVNLKNQLDGQNGLVDMFADRAETFTITPKTEDGSADVQGQDIDVTFVDTIPLDTLPRKSTAPKSTVFMVVAPYQLKDRFEAPGEQEQLGLTFLSKNTSRSEAQMTEMIQKAGITSEYDLHNVYKVLEQNRSTIFVVNVFSYGFIIMISLIATANVFNTVSTNIRMRRRELAMLRSVGMDDCDFSRMMNFECIFYGTKVLLFGLPIAGIFSWMIYEAMILSGEEIAFSLPWGSIGIAAFSVFFVVFITMLYATRKIKKENIIDALRDDMT